jgi:diguanylate cyclase (GGDEF)-like protein
MTKDDRQNAYASDGLLLQLLDRNGLIVDVNRGWTAALNYNPEEILGRHFCDFIEPGHCETVADFLRNLRDDRTSRFLPVVMRDKTQHPIEALLVAQPLSGDAGFACEIWTSDGMARAMANARTQSDKEKAEEILVRTFTAVTELLSKSDGVSDFLRDLGLLLEAVSGIPRAIVEPPSKSPSPVWMPPVIREIRRIHGPAKTTGTLVLEASRHAGLSPELAATFGGKEVLALWFPDSSMPSARRHLFIELPADRILAETWKATAPPFARAVANALCCLTTWEHQAALLSKASVQSVTDPLTRIFNRYKLEESLTAEERRARRYGTWFSVVLADIDHFKSVNDTFGHPAGDRVLEEVANELRTSTRSTDVVGRWGGEEFLIVCVHTKLDGACTLAENLRQRIADRPFPEIGGVSLSFGVSTYEDGDAADDVIARADRALYRAKHEGRNRVCRLTREA